MHEIHRSSVVELSVRDEPKFAGSTADAPTLERKDTAPEEAPLKAVSSYKVATLVPLKTRKKDTKKDDGHLSLVTEWVAKHQIGTSGRHQCHLTCLTAANVL